MENHDQEDKSDYRHQIVENGGNQLIPYKKDCYRKGPHQYRQYGSSKSESGRKILLAGILLLAGRPDSLHHHGEDNQQADGNEG